MSPFDPAASLMGRDWDTGSRLPATRTIGGGSAAACDLLNLNPVVRRCVDDGRDGRGPDDHRSDHEGPGGRFRRRRRKRGGARERRRGWRRESSCPHASATLGPLQNALISLAYVWPLRLKNPPPS